MTQVKMPEPSCYVRMIDEKINWNDDDNFGQSYVETTFENEACIALYTAKDMLQYARDWLEQAVQYCNKRAEFEVSQINEYTSITERGVAKVCAQTAQVIGLQIKLMLGEIK